MIGLRLDIEKGVEKRERQFGLERIVGVTGTTTYYLGTNQGTSRIREDILNKHLLSNSLDGVWEVEFKPS